MSVRIIAVGKLSTPFLCDAEAEYLKRLTPFLRVGITELPNSKSKEALVAIEEEGRRIQGAFRPREQVIALDEAGDSVTSAQFAKMLEKLLAGGDLAFVIGGAFGLSKAVAGKAKRTLSLSPLTFTYQFARVILVEQLYRATCINRGVDYHK